MESFLRTIYTCYPFGKHKALTMSYDDGRIYDKKLIEIFNKNKIKGTFHLNSGLMGECKVQLDEIAEVYAGHEVSCHTYTHPTISRCPLDQVVQQIITDRRILEKACGYPIRGMSYPNGSYNEKIVNILPACGIEYCRVVGNTDDFILPESFLTWKSTCHHNHNLMENARRFADLNKTQHLYLMYVWGHSYEFPRDDNWELMEGFCEFIGGRDDIWYATNIEIVDYLNAAENLKYSAAGDMVYNPSAMSVWISADGEIYEIHGGETLSI